MIRGIWLLAAVATAALPQTAENVLLVVNDSSAVSRQIGDYYASKRAVPPANVCRLKTTSDEQISRQVFDEQVAKPIATCLKSRRLQEKVLYIVTTLGVPLKIAGTGDRFGTYASVDSELSLLYSDMKTGRAHALNGPLPNPFFQLRDTPFRHPQFPIYLVTRLAGYDFTDVKGIIDKALVAKNRGKFVIDLKSETDEMGNDWLRNASILLPGNRVVSDETSKVITNEKDVIAYASWGSNDPNRHERNLGFTWLPGAIVTEFVSTDARTFLRPPENWNLGNWKDAKTFFAMSPQTMTADYIHQGATGASGHTSEPYLVMTPRPDIVLPAYYTGRNLAESFYLGIPALSWQNVVIGDPLCSLGKP